MKVSQLENKNQYVIKNNDKVEFQSYNSLIASWDYKNQLLTLGCDWDYSLTTRKHLYIFIDKYTKINIPYNCQNKRAYIQQMIDNHIINYDENME